MDVIGAVGFFEGVTAVTLLREVLNSCIRVIL